MAKFLAFDFGAESGRAVVGIIEDNRIKLEVVHRFPNKQVKVLGTIYWDILYLFDELKKGLSLAVQQGHHDIQSIGIDTWGVDFGLIGKDGQLLGLPVAYRDERTNGIMEKVFDKISQKEIYQKTGIQFMQLNTLFQLYSIQLNNPALLAHTDKLLFMPDLFNYFLTGKAVSEYTIASTSQMLDVNTRQWDCQLLESLGIPFSIMAPIVKPGTVTGTLLPQAANEAGFINPVDVIAVGCHDTASAVLTVPMRFETCAYLSSGTWSLIGIESDHPIVNDEALACDFTNEGGVGNKIRFLCNVTGLWLIQELKKSRSRHGEDFTYEQLVDLASSAKEFRCVLNPDDPLFLNPPDMAEAVDAYCLKTNQQILKTTGEYARVIFESLAFKYKSVIEKINWLTKKKITALHIVGGGSMNRLLNQFTADAVGIPVYAGPVEATATGNILQQAITKGILPSIKEARRLVERSFDVELFAPNDSLKWEKARPR